MIGGAAGCYEGRKVAKRLKLSKKDQKRFVASYGIKGAIIGGVLGGLMGYGVGVAIGAKTTSGLAITQVNKAVRVDTHKIHHIMQEKHLWKSVTKNGTWKQVQNVIKITLKKEKLH